MNDLTFNQDFPASMASNLDWPHTGEVRKIPITAPNGNEWPKISVIIPSYNQGQFLEEAIRSVLLQGYPNCELIVIDGGSDDISLEVLEKYDRWITYWESSPDRGQSHAINKGFQKAEGDVITWLNSDDYYLPRTFEKVGIAFSNDSLISALVGGCTQVDENGDFLYLRPPTDLDYKRIIMGGDIPGQPAVFLNGRGLKEVGDMREDLKYVLDWEYWLRVGYRYPGQDQVFQGILAVERIWAGRKTVNTSRSDAETEKQEIIKEYHTNGIISSRIEKKGISTALFTQGLFNFKNGKKKRARLDFWKAFRQHPTLFSFIKYLLMTAGTFTGYDASKKLSRLSPGVVKSLWRERKNSRSKIGLESPAGIPEGIIPPLNAILEPPQVAIYLATPRAGHWKYSVNLYHEVETSCLLVAPRDTGLQNQWCAPIVFSSPGPHDSLLSKTRLFLGHILNIWRLVRVSKKTGAKVIHFQSFEPISIGLFLPIIKRSFKLMVSVHNVLPHRYYFDFTKGLETRIRRSIFQQADHLFVFSHYGADKLRSEFNIPAEKIQYLRMGVHEAVPNDLPVKDKLPESPTFLVFGVYRPNKGFELLREAFISAKRAGLKGRLLVAGMYPKQIEEDTREMFTSAGFADQLDMINNYIEEEEIDGIARSADFLLLPYTNFESQSGVVFMAYAYNLPIIATRVGGLSELIEEDGTGVLCEPGDIPQLTEALFEGIDRWEQLNRVQSNILLHTKYAWKGIAQGTDKIYEQYLD